MRTKPYYSLRTGINKNKNLDIHHLKQFFYSIFQQFNHKDYFQENLGFNCVDAGDVNGKLGSNINTVLMLNLRKEMLWPIDQYINDYSEDDLFDMIEFTHDIVSKPLSGWYHDYSNCGYHYNIFDKEAGQEEYRIAINNILKDYRNGYELSSEGYILNRSEPGFENLFAAPIPTENSQIKDKMEIATLKFRKHGSSLIDRRDAIRDLADILEFLRPDAKKILTKKDDDDLFNIANNFAIRHYNQLQSDQYDKPIWYSWIFYVYLATIHAILRFIEKNNKKA